MYIILQFGAIWAIYDHASSNTRLLEKLEIEGLLNQFRNLVSNAVLTVIQLQKISPSRLTKAPGTGYVIVRVGEMWTMYESGNLTPKILEKAKIAQFGAIFPKLVDGQMLSAIAVDTLSPARLLSLPMKVEGQAVTSPTATPAVA